jgi:hypothetical protein
MLQANPITELDVESAGYAIFAEWLAKYFDGRPHDVGGHSQVPFPKAAIAFGQSPASQPQNPAGKADSQSSITMVWGTPVSTTRHWETLGGATVLMVYKKVRWNFWVRAEMQASDTGNARKLCRQTAEKLSALLLNPATTRELAQKGIFHTRPAEPEPVSETGYILMLVSVRAQLRYPVLVGEPQPAAVIDTGTPDNVTPAVRIKNGLLEIWDSGQQAYVPLLIENGVIGTGAPDAT